MIDPRRKIVWSFLLLLSISVIFLYGQMARQTGVIRGVITDNEDNPIPGMTVTATSPSLIGTVTAVTGADGSYRLTNLPPGTYTVVAELSGFKTVRREGIIVTVGTIVTINLQTEASPISEEITVVGSAPVVDVQSTKVGVVVTSDLINRLPLNRSLTNIFFTVPGTAGTIDTYSGSIHGSDDTAVTFEVDGVASNDPAHNGLLQAPLFDTMEEIEISTGGLPAQVGNTGGAFVNIVTKSGGNEFHGQLQAFYTKKELSQLLYSSEQLKAMNIGKPVFPIYDLDSSFILGGPIIKDKIWFFTSAAIRDQKSPSSFIPAVLGGKQYTQYDDPQTQYEGFFKLTAQLAKNLRFFTMINGRLLNRDVYLGGGTFTAYDATFTIKGNTWVQGTANLTWILSPNTFVDFRAGYVNRWYPIQEREESYNNICYYDAYTGYTWGGVNTWESYITRTSAQGSARATHFQDGFLGGNHEFGMGVEYTFLRDKYYWARHSPFNWYLYNGNPYYWRGYYNISGPDPTHGDGRLVFVNYTDKNGDCGRTLPEIRISGYLQDAWTIRNRLTINLGVRADYYNGWAGAVEMAGVTGLRFDIGKSLEPELGYNHFAAYKIDPIKDILKFFVLSPRIGFSYDLFGNGKTAFKLAVSKYYEAVPAMWFSQASGAQMASWSFDWWDLNNNGQPDSPPIDKYYPTNGLGSLWRPDVDYLKDRVDPDLTPQQYIEIVTGVKHEVLRNLAVEIQYIYKRGWNTYGTALYDRTTGKYWYKLEDAPAGWWVPFKTYIPAYADYPEQEVTVYFMSRTAPWNNLFYRQTNMPDSKRNYHSVELNFNKRYADGWALGGSIAWSKHMFFDGSPSSPNGFLNGYGRDNYDYPLIIKLYGSFDLPWGFVASFFYRHTSGSPYGRTVSVSPPAAWCTANNVYRSSYTIRVEPNGARRNPDFDNFDLRVEKEVGFSFGTIAAFLDIYNVFGSSYLTVGMNPGGTWYPTDVGVKSGSFVVSSTYGKVTGISGTRTFKFGLRFKF